MLLSDQELTGLCLVFAIIVVQLRLHRLMSKFVLLSLFLGLGLTKTTVYLVPSALDKKTDSIMFIVENREQLVRKVPLNAVACARNRYGFALTRGGIFLDEFLDAVVINVICRDSQL